MTVLYLLRVACPVCGAVTTFVEERDAPVGLMQDVPLSASCCPGCGVDVDRAGEEWDVVEDAIVERVDPHAVEEGSR